MYKSNRNRQISFSDFNQPVGLKMNPENRWIKRAETIPWQISYPQDVNLLNETRENLESIIDETGFARLERHSFIAIYDFDFFKVQLAEISA